MKRVKALIDEGEYSSAAAALENFLESDEEFKGFPAYNNLGQCYLKDGQGKKAVAAFKAALQYEPQQALAPFWKTLSEAYDLESQWTESGDALAKQYEIVAKKNPSKAIEVCKSCLDRWQKTKKLQGSLDEVWKCCKFLHAFLHKEWILDSLKSPANQFSFVIQLIELQYRARDIKLEAAKGKLSSKSVETETEQRPTELNPMSFSVMRAVEIILGEGSIESLNAQTLNCKALSQGILEMLESRRAALLKPTSETDSESKDLLSQVYGLVVTHRDFALPPVDAASFAFEAWLNSGQEVSFNQVLTLADLCLSHQRQDSTKDSFQIVGAHIVKAIHIAESGVLSSAQPHLLAIHAYWSSLAPKKGSLDFAECLAKSFIDRKYAFLEWATYILSVGGAFGAMDRGGYMKDLVPVSTYMALTRQAKEWAVRRAELGPSHRPLRRLWTESVCLSRVHALIAARECTAARVEAIEVLPLYFYRIDRDRDGNGSIIPSAGIDQDQDALTREDVGVHTKAILLACRHVHVQHLSARLLLHALLGMHLHAAAKAISTELLVGHREAETAPSYLSSDNAYASVCEVMSLFESAIDGSTMLQAERSSSLLLSTDLSSSPLPAATKESTLAIISDAVTTLRGVLTCTDAFVNEIKCEVHYRIGAALWVSGGAARTDKKCVSALLASAKLSPSHEAPYTLLGHHYLLVSNDKARAVKCYLKALQCSPLEADAGLALSALWMADLDAARLSSSPSLSSVEDAETKLLKLWADAVKLAPNAGWVPHVRGRYYLQQGLLISSTGSLEAQAQRSQHLEVAEADLQRALELLNGTWYTWYLLGCARFHLSRFGSAKAALVKSHQMDPTSTLPLSLHGRAALCSGQIRDATKLFTQALSLRSDDMLALKGAAEAQLMNAYLYLSWGWSSGAAVAIGEGLRFAEKAIKIRAGAEEEGLLSLWKIKADLCTLTGRVDARDVMLTGTITVSPDASPEMRRIAAMEEGEQCYRKIVDRLRSIPKEVNDAGSDDESAARARLRLAKSLNDVGCNVYSRLVLSLRLKGVTSGLCTKQCLLRDNPPLLELSEKALSCFREGLRAAPQCAECWTGVAMCHSDDEIACACFVRATQLQPDCLPAHLNLALRMASCGYSGAARDALGEVLMISGEPGAWTAVGLLEEQQYIRQLLPSSQVQQHAGMKQAHDAYRVALEVAKPSEARLGLAMSYLRIKGVLAGEEGEMVSVMGMPIVSFALDRTQLKFVADNVSAYIQDEAPFHPGAWCLLGWLREQQGDDYIEKAAEGYRNALMALETILAGAPGMVASASAGLKQRIVTLAESASGRFAYLSLRATTLIGTASPVSTIPRVKLSSFPLLDCTVPSFAPICAFIAQPDAFTLSKVPGTGLRTAASSVALQAWSVGDIGACATALRGACSEEGVMLWSIAESLALMRELSCSRNQQLSQQLVAACGAWLEDLLSPLYQDPYAEAELDSVLDAPSSSAFSPLPRPLLQFLLGPHATLDPLLWVITANREAASITDKGRDKIEDYENLNRALLRLGLSRWPLSAVLFLWLGEYGGGDVGVGVASLLLSRGLLTEECYQDNSIIASDSSAFIRWSAPRCFQQAVNLCTHCLEIGSEPGTSPGEDEEGAMHMPIFNQNWVQHSLLLPAGAGAGAGAEAKGANTAAIVLGVALLKLSMDSPARTRIALLKAARWHPEASSALLEAASTCGS